MQGQSNSHRTQQQIQRCGNQADHRQRPDAEQRHRHIADARGQSRPPRVPSCTAGQHRSGKTRLEREPADHHGGQEARDHPVSERPECPDRDEREVLSRLAGQVTQCTDVTGQHGVAQCDRQHPAPKAQRVDDEPAKYGAGQDHREPEPHRANGDQASSRVLRNRFVLVLGSPQFGGANGSGI